MFEVVSLYSASFESCFGEREKCRKVNLSTDSFVSVQCMNCQTTTKKIPFQPDERQVSIRAEELLDFIEARDERC